MRADGSVLTMACVLAAVYCARSGRGSRSDSQGTCQGTLSMMTSKWPPELDKARRVVR
jgi:hypothetical protein